MRTAVVQINSGPDRDLNIESAGRQVLAAVEDGAEFVVLPEKWSLLVTGDAVAEGAEDADGEAMTAARGWARGHGIHLLAGSFTEKSADGGLPANTSILVSPDGSDVASYRKIHMFDVDVGGVEYRESDTEAAGDEVVAAPLGTAKLGMTVCYDLRFPELFRALLDLGADIFAVPSAFTAVTGRDHWKVLLRARAIENQGFVVAANQFGTAEPHFDSWGHSMIVDPWGRVLADAGDAEGYAIADLDFAERDRILGSLPAIHNRRPDLFRNGEGAA